MTRPPLPRPPAVSELAELARLLAAEAPATLPTFLWCVCRSTRAAEACRKQRPSGVQLMTIRNYPAGRQLISSSQAGTDWLNKWSRTSQALNGLLPPIALAVRDDEPGDQDGEPSDQDDESSEQDDESSEQEQ